MMNYPEKIRQFEIDGFSKWVWPKEDDGAWDGPVDDWIVSHKPLIERFQRRRTVIQAGGNCGLYPTLLSNLFDTVHTCEPDPENYHFLIKNTFLCNNVHRYNIALGASECEVGMHRPTMNNVGMHMINDDGQGIDMTTIDLKFGEVDMVDFLWLDIEGYEFHAIYGAQNVIRNNLPIISLENPQLCTKDLLTSMGYNPYTTSKMDTVFVHPEGNQLI